MLPRTDSLEVIAENERIPLYVAAIRNNSQLMRNVNYWPEINDIDGLAKVDSGINLLGDKTPGLLAAMARDISQVIKFPVNTAYLHALGVAASAMTKSFKYQYNGNPKPVTLFVCTAQPPSTGKSGVNDILLDPVREAYDEINKKNKKTRRGLLLEKKALEKSLSNPAIHENAINSKMELLERVIEDLENTPIWKPTIKDTTIEAAEQTAAQQTGMINIVSDEAEAINTIFGNTYVREGGGSVNFGLLLSAWDGDRNESARVGREAYYGYVRGSIAVLAQNDSVESVLRAGATGRGLAERFLLIAEESLLGKRDHFLNIAPDLILHQRYAETISNIVNEDSVILTIDKGSTELISGFRAKIEREMGEGGKYEHQLLTGFMGKADKQIAKIASVLHVMEHWQPGGHKSRKVSEDHVLMAIAIFDELSKTYINAADNMGYVGEKSELTALIEILITKASKNEMKLSIRKLVNDIKRKKPFNGMRNLTRRVKVVLETLQNNNYIHVENNDVYINPRLK